MCQRQRQGHCHLLSSFVYVYDWSWNSPREWLCIKRTETLDSEFAAEFKARPRVHANEIRTTTATPPLSILSFKEILRIWNESMIWITCATQIAP